MTTISLSPTTVVSLSQILIKIARKTEKCKAQQAEYYFETAHVEVLRFIADPADQTASNAVRTIRYAMEYMKSIRSADGQPQDQRNIAHELGFNYYNLKRSIRAAQEIHKLEKSEA